MFSSSFFNVVFFRHNKCLTSSLWTPPPGLIVLTDKFGHEKEEEEERNDNLKIKERKLAGALLRLDPTGQEGERGPNNSLLPSRSPIQPSAVGFFFLSQEGTQILTAVSLFSFC